LPDRNNHRLAGGIQGQFLGHHVGSNLNRAEATVDEVRVRFDLADPIGKIDPRSPFGHTSFHSLKAFSTKAKGGTTCTPFSI
jgi:hypothetical protein